MADDNEIIIPVKVETDDAKKALDDLANTASETFDRVVAKQSSNAGITPEEFLRRGRDFADNGPKYVAPQEPDESNASPPGPREPPGNGGKEGHGVRYINVEQQLLGETSEGAAESTAGIRLFREALHALHPALAEAGIGVGELSALVSAARGGFIALSVAIGTLIVTALERAGDAANDAASRLGAFAGGITAGKEQYGRLSETADQLKTPTSGLVAPFEQATRLNQTQPVDAQLPEAGLLEAVGNVVKGGQSERADTSKVLEALTKFLSDGREKGFFGPNDFKALENIAPRTAAAIAEQLPKGRSTFTGSEVLGAVRAAGPQIDANAVEALKLPDSIPTAWEHVKASYEKLAEATTGGHAVSGTLDALAAFFDSAAGRFKKVSEAADNLRAAQENQDRNEGARQADVILKQSQAPFVEATNKSSQSQLPLPVNQFSPQERPAPLVPESAFNVNGKLDTAAEKSAHALDKLSDSSESLAARQAKFGITAEDALKAKSTDITLQQAEIERKFEPKETANKIAREQISVQNADLHFEGAVISGLEAQKGQEQSRLAPEEATERLNSAESNLRKAEHKFNQTHGVRDNFNQGLEDRFDSEDALDAARTAVRRARIEKKYAYLEEPKANLAAEQAQTAIRSAELEKNDKSLILAKDSQGAPLSHELSQLRYADALLNEEKQQSKYQGEMASTLRDVLGALNKRTNDPDEKARRSLLDDNSKRANAEDINAPNAAATSARIYEENARRSGVRTVEGDQQAREQAFSQGKHYGSEQSVEGDRIAREKASGATTATHNTPAEKLSGAADDLKDAAKALKEVAGAGGVAGGGAGGAAGSSASTEAGTTTAGTAVTSSISAAATPSTSAIPPPATKSNEAIADSEKIQAALDKFKLLGSRLKEVDPDAAKLLSGLSDRSDGSVKSARPTTRDQLDKTLTNQRQVGEYEGIQAGEFTKDIRDQVGKHEPFDRMGLGSPSRAEEQRGTVPHPYGGNADLSEKLYPGGPNRYRYQGDPNYRPAELGTYDENQNFVPNKHQPYPRLREKPYASDKPYSRLEDTFDNKGGGDKNPIYNYGQPQPMDFPDYTKHLRDTLPPVPLPQPRPPEAPQPQPEATPQPQAAPQPQPQVAGQQFASLGDAWQQFIDAATAKLNAATAKPVDQSGQPPSNAGVRGDAGTGDDGSGGKSNDIGQTVETLQAALSSLTESVQGDAAFLSGDVQHAAEGRYIRGPGTSTSDSIPAMLSDREYVHSARATEHWGVDTMHELNSLRVPAIFQNFNLGGLAARISRATTPPLALASGGVARSAPSATPSQMEHWGTLDMRSNHGDYKIATERDTMRHLSSNAQKAKRVRNGRQPNWYGGASS